MEDDDFEQFSDNEGDFFDEEEETEQDNANVEFELEREEPESKSAEEFLKFLQGCEYPDEIITYIKGLKLFEKDEKTHDIIPTKSLKKTITGFCLFLVGKKRLQKSVLSTYSKIFGAYDIFHYISADLAKRILGLKDTNVAAWFNVFNFLSIVPYPSDKLTKPLFPRFCKRTPFNDKQMKRRKRVWAANDLDKVWMAIISGNANSKVSLKMIPYITENVLTKMKEPFKTADFFYKMFDKKDIHAILSLAAIFKLITVHNFEYPKFYDKVYSLMRPSLLYMDHKEQVLTLLDTFLSSTHIPIYIVASFIKRLSRCLILAPVDAQEPILGLIRNLLIRHANCSELVHKTIPETYNEDPFDDKTEDLHKTKALESSLWEIKLLQSHWNQNVRKRAHFIDNKLQKMESFVKFRSVDELFSVNMAKSFGGEDGEAEKYRKLQDGDEDEEVGQPVAKKGRKGKGFGKFAAKHEEKVVKGVALNTEAPVSILERKVVNVDTPVLWKL